mgnify:CR=1 FL=1
MGNGSIVGLLALIVGLAALWASYQNVERPYLFTGNTGACPSSLDVNSNYTFMIPLSNQANGDGHVQICLNSSGVLFNSTIGLVNKVCTSDIYIPKKDSGLIISPDYMRFTAFVAEAKNVTFELSISCKQKVWAVLSRACSGYYKTCNYVVEGYQSSIQGQRLVLRR